VVELEGNASVTYGASGEVRVIEEGESRLVGASGVGERRRVVVPGGRQASVELPDGSRAWLNASTTLEFPPENGPRREAWVSGEIYVEVVRDSTRPFLLHAAGVTVEVLGTSFDARAYAGEGLVSVVLVEGRVTVSVPSGGVHELQPSERLEVDDTGASRVTRVEVGDYTSWREGVLRFTDTPLPAILSALSLHYGVPIEHEGLDGVHLTGKLVLFDNLSTVLDNITVLTSFRHVLEGETVVIRRTWPM
jgi:ferric-dicitrate binding protein FerR (iron transport regulator)